MCNVSLLKNGDAIGLQNKDQFFNIYTVLSESDKWLTVTD